LRYNEQDKSIYRGRWQRVRAKALRRDGHRCQNCQRYGRSRAASTVHHVVPVREDPTRAYDLANLISLCPKCHGSFHKMTDQTLSAAGLQVRHWWAQKHRAMPTHAGAAGRGGNALASPLGSES